jgi:hypothetical protein
MQNLRLSYAKERVLCRSVRLKGFSGVSFFFSFATVTTDPVTEHGRTKWSYFEAFSSVWLRKMGKILCFQSHGGGDDLTKSLFFAIFLDMPSKVYKKLTPPYCIFEQ